MFKFNLLLNIIRQLQHIISQTSTKWNMILEDKKQIVLILKAFHEKLKQKINKGIVWWDFTSLNFSDQFTQSMIYDDT